MIQGNNTFQYANQLVPSSTNEKPDFPIVGADAVATYITHNTVDFVTTYTFEPLSNKLSEIDTSIESIDTTVQTLTEKVNNNETSIGTINDNISDINGRIDNITSSPGGEIVEIEQNTGENINSNTFNAVSSITKENNKIKVKTDTITIPESTNINITEVEPVTMAPKFGESVSFSADTSEVGTNTINNRKVGIIIPKLEIQSEPLESIDISKNSANFVSNISIANRVFGSNAYLKETTRAINVDTLKNKVDIIGETYFYSIHTVPPTEVKIGDPNRDTQNKKDITLTSDVSIYTSDKHKLLTSKHNLNFSPMIEDVRTSYNGVKLLTEQMNTVVAENQYLKNCIEQIRTADTNGNYEPYVPTTLKYTGTVQQLILPGKSTEYDYYYSTNSNPDLNNSSTYTTDASKLTAYNIGSYTVKYIAVPKQ